MGFSGVYVPLSSAAEKVMTLKTEPSGYLLCAARLSEGVFGSLVSATMPLLLLWFCGSNKLGS